MTEIQEGSRVARVNYRAVEGAIDALELAFSYIRDQGNHVCERRIEDALHYLRRAKEINEPRVNIRFLAANDEDSAVSNLVAAARVVNDELSHGEWSERSRARLNNALIDVDALSSEDATRPTGDKSGPEDGQSDTVPMKRPVMEGVDPAATDSGHVGASTYMWLIERGQAEHQEPTVWATKTGPMTWSQDPWAAILFQTKAAAESFIAEHLTHPTRGPSARVVQHGFSRPTGDKE